MKTVKADSVTSKQDKEKAQEAIAGYRNELENIKNAVKPSLTILYKLLLTQWPWNGLENSD